ncbi:MAG: hypothetical protein FWH15_09000 [Betaproteobacteria bacterium]|nr:hypothetical protein [Betaproteobacteria bacterium]
MKKIIVFLFVIGGAWFLFQQTEKQRQSSLNPEVISSPVYVETRITQDIQGRSIEMAFFGKAVDERDCMQRSKNMLENLQKSDSAGRWVLKSSECKSELSPRYAKLFDNEPTFVTYISIARGNRYEREGRLIFWGVSVEESDMICDLAPKLRSDFQGVMTCIRAIR